MAINIEPLLDNNLLITPTQVDSLPTINENNSNPNITPVVLPSTTVDLSNNAISETTLYDSNGLLNTPVINIPSNNSVRPENNQPLTPNIQNNVPTTNLTDTTPATAPNNVQDNDTNTNLINNTNQNLSQNNVDSNDLNNTNTINTTATAQVTQQQNISATSLTNNNDQNLQSSIGQPNAVSNTNGQNVSQNNITTSNLTDNNDQNLQDDSTVTNLQSNGNNSTQNTVTTNNTNASNTSNTPSAINAQDIIRQNAAQNTNSANIQLAQDSVTNSLAVDNVNNPQRSVLTSAALNENPEFAIQNKNLTTPLTVPTANINNGNTSNSINTQNVANNINTQNENNNPNTNVPIPQPVLNQTIDPIMQAKTMEFLQSLHINKDAIKNATSTNNFNEPDNDLSVPIVQPVDRVAGQSDNSSYNSTHNPLVTPLANHAFRQFNEYLADDKLGIVLKVDSNIDPDLQKNILSAIENEIKNYQNKETP